MMKIWFKFNIIIFKVCHNNILPNGYVDDIYNIHDIDSIHPIKDQEL